MKNANNIYLNRLKKLAQEKSKKPKKSFFRNGKSRNTSIKSILVLKETRVLPEKNNFNNWSVVAAIMSAMATIFTAWLIYRQLNISIEQNGISEIQNQIQDRQTKLIEKQTLLFEQQNTKIDSQNVLFGTQNDLVDIQNTKTETQNLLIDSQNNLLNFQNERISQQTKLQEAERRSSLVFLFNNTLDKIDEELKDSANTKRILSKQLVARIISLSIALKPYQYLQNDNIIKKKVSPERGQLLSTLANSQLDSVSLNEILSKGDFTYSELINGELRGLKTVKNVDLSHSNFNNTDLSNIQFYNCQFESTHFKKSEMSGVGFRNCIIKDCFFNEAILEDADFENTGQFMFFKQNQREERLSFMLLLVDSISSPNISVGISDSDDVFLKMNPNNFPTYFITNTSYKSADLTNSSFKNITIKNSYLNNAKCRSIDFNNTILFDTKLNGIFIQPSDFDKYHSTNYPLMSIRNYYKISTDNNCLIDSQYEFGTYTLPIEFCTRLYKSKP